jgi:hypothetical protein
MVARLESLAEVQKSLEWRNIKSLKSGQTGTSFPA